jgi:peptidoglycan/LPS O-acetylase OafA/YrhL
MANEPPISTQVAGEVADSAATGSDRFRPDIEGLRAIAVVAVVLFHAGVPGFSGGYVGVDVFFVISGFLITGQMLRDREASSGFGFGQFYARRIRRLLPIATLVILVVLAGSALFHSPFSQESVGDDAQASALFSSNLRFADQATDYFQDDAPPSYPSRRQTEIEFRWKMLMPDGVRNPTRLP